MFRFLRIWIIDTFGFSKTEANGTLVMIAILLIVAIVPKIFLHQGYKQQKGFHSDTVKLNEWANQLNAALALKELKQPNQNVFTAGTKVVEREEFDFDPNITSRPELEKLGFSSKTSWNIKKYRESGGAFKVKKDLKKIYGISQQRVDELWNFISLPEEIEKVVVAERPEAAKKEISVFAINEATAAELQQIRGIGPVLSNRIVKYRNRLGGFHSAHQLGEVYGISPELVIEIQERITLSESVKTISVNTDSLKHLYRHPYIDYNLARVILNYRKQHGKLDSVAQIKSIKILSDSLYQKIYPYLSVDP